MFKNQSKVIIEHASKGKNSVSTAFGGGDPLIGLGQLCPKYSIPTHNFDENSQNEISYDEE